ncbi:LytR/AlgR family response regulator transcription factor [Mucilaginibacter sp. OK098]|uniref:LytR/AlgR family response regulator transcription factor n=1 Tax=Mucilaginibacter sp. OK098 TaxID=1855297 RepID=UPI0009211C05|nr:LytTR family DNA-binding domain-containing protein [Mucilaginibacter sp. OK098]SHM80077.1 two component transcriptional regulator, LytTR family [Mucilaginibacter sp. OK098]
MKVLIIEDEAPAARRLQLLLESYDPSIRVISVIDSIEDAVQWLKDFPHPELIFMDIMLADGQSFEIFEQVQVNVPIIFTTAYDEYAIRAFKVNSIDYLLKPIEPLLLESSLKKYKTLAPSPEKLKEVMESLLVTNYRNRQPQSEFKNRFLVKVGDKFIPVPISEVAYFSFEDKLTFLNTTAAKRYMLDHTLDELEKLIDPQLFFRLNRQYIVSFPAIKAVHNYFNGKLKVYVTPELSTGIVVSKDKSHYLKLWLNR